jgi:hypothetical protein
MEFKHIVIKKENDSWLVYNKHSKEMIGSIFYYKPWKKYVYEPQNDTVYDESCLADILQFMKTEVQK